MIKIKTDAEIKLLKEVGLALGRVFDKLRKHIVPGVTTLELDKLARKYIKEENCTPTFYLYNGFPGAICTSVNDELIHGIPSDKVVLKDGDILSIDMGLTSKEGYIADATRTFPVGNISEEAKNIIKACEECFFNAIKEAKPGNRVSDISHQIDVTAKKYNYCLVHEYCGHGVGTKLHEDPQVPNYGAAGRGELLRKNMCIAVEPMILEGSRHVYVDPFNDWTVISCNHKLTCHYENTIVITDDGCEITTVDSSLQKYLNGEEKNEQ